MNDSKRGGTKEVYIKGLNNLHRPRKFVRVIKRRRMKLVGFDMLV